MDFFNELGSKLSMTGKTVADKAKDLTEITRLNAKVVSEESKLNKAYAEIGKLYYAECRGEMADAYAEAAETIRTALAEIASAKEQINVLKGVRTCAQCGREMGKNDLYCGSCGAKNEPAAEEAPKSKDQVCPVCKSIVPADLQYCPTCGEKLTGEAAEAAPEAAAEETVEVAEEAAEAMEVPEAAAEPAEAAEEEAAGCAEEASEACCECENKDE